MFQNITVGCGVDLFFCSVAEIFIKENSQKTFACGVTPSIHVHHMNFKSLSSNFNLFERLCQMEIRTYKKRFEHLQSVELSKPKRWAEFEENPSYFECLSSN